MSEMKQLHDCIYFKPLKIEDMSIEEKKRAIKSLIFVTKKKDGRLKSRTCANGSKQRIWSNREENASPTISTKGLLMTYVIDAKEERDVMLSDILNAFVKTDNENYKDGKQVVMKLYGALVDMLVELDPQTYQDFVVLKNGKKLYLWILKAIYGLLKVHFYFTKTTLRP